MFERIVAQHWPDARLLEVQRLTGGTSASMTALTIRTGAGVRKKLVVRQPKSPDARQALDLLRKEFRVLQIAQAAGCPTPAAHRVDELDDLPYLVLEHVEGRSQFQPVDLEDHLGQLASALARIHKVDAAAFDRSFLPTSPDLGRDTASLGRNAGAFGLEGLKTEQVEAGTAVHSPRNPPTLLHGDFWPGNTLWRDQQLVAVIDWEDAEFGDPLIDLARSRSEIAWIFGLPAAQTFTRIYQQHNPLDLHDLPGRDLEALARLLRIAQADAGNLSDFLAGLGGPRRQPDAIRQDLQGFLQQTRG